VTISFSIPIDPVPKARPRMSRRGQVYTPKTTAQFERVLSAMSRAHRPAEPLLGPLAVSVKLYMRRPRMPSKSYPRGDVDNYAKAILDALQGESGIFKDDNQIVSLKVSKQYAESGSISIRIRSALQET